MTTKRILEAFDEHFNMDRMYDKEADLLKAVRGYLEYMPCLTYIRQNATTIAGIPDILVCFNGRFVALELKGKNGVTSQVQLEKIAKIEKAGGVAAVCYCLKHVKDALLKTIVEGAAMCDILYKLNKTPEDISYLINQHKQLVYAMLKKTGQLDNQDAESAAWEALWDAVSTFDVFAENAFSTYACTLIRNAIGNEIRRGLTKKRRALLVEIDVQEETTVLCDDLSIYDMVQSSEGVQRIYRIFEEYLEGRTGIARDVLLAWYSNNFECSVSNLAAYCKTSSSTVSRTQCAFRAYLAYRLKQEGDNIGHRTT